MPQTNSEAERCSHVQFTSNQCKKSN
ncbi:hypothetical protein F383_09486 [Gossypium arboreum]|uniref:Uncharacterized protein n=1 Tax=Gossypium arboreum TaxID=29729 RepID=A0A0B0PJK0_GOSAR|nr:hypothetical protein F383_09486 [Gossypium arboreum]